VTLYLVRHAMPAVDPGSDPASWELSAGGRGAVRALAPQATVAGRFAAAIAECEFLAGDRDLVIASHGMAMTVWLDEVIGLADPAAFWADLQFPDLLKVDLPARTVTRLITR
jgi:broad specificity phosphatase PhoE